MQCGPDIDLVESSEATGRFEVRASTGIVPNAPCTLRIEKEGFAPTSSPVEECGSQWTNCSRDLGQIALAH